MCELKEIVKEGVKTMIRIVDYLDNHEIKVGGDYCVEDIRKFFTWLTGYADCLDLYGLISSDHG